MSSDLHQLKKNAKADKIPIISDDGLSFLISNIKKYNVKKILEIGAAVGYSAICMAQYAEKVDTFEKDASILEKLYKNIESFNLSEKITVYPYDARFFEGSIDEYDLIFIDAAKAQYEKFFSKYKNNLTDSGIIICDNLDFHNLNPEEVSKKTRNLLKKIADFKKFLMENEEFDTEINHIGDGMSLSKRK